MDAAPAQDGRVAATASSRPGRRHRFPAVAARVSAAIAQASDLPAFRDVLRHLLARPGRVLAPTGPAKWPAFVVETARSLGGNTEAAVEAAAAVELAVAAADVVDDLVDDEWDAADGAPERALNASLALSFLALRQAGRLRGWLGAERTGLLAQLLADGVLAACTGEDLDLTFERTAAVTEELAHDMTRRKSGSLVAMACQVGAAIAGADSQVLALVGAFGGHVGTVAQLLNDLGDVDPANPARKNDLRRRKKTLPVAYALHCARSEGLSNVLAFYEREDALGDEEEAELARLVCDLGGLQYAWVVADVHRREALASIEALARLTGRASVRDLRHLVPSVRGRWNPLGVT